MKRFLSVFLLISLLLTGLCGCLPTEEPKETPPTAQNGSLTSDLEIHFIDVGQADAALILCSGRSMLIDGGNREDSSRIYSYLQRLGITHLDYVVCTHAHEDHVGGLSGALTAATAGRVLAPVTEYDTKVFSDFVAKAEAQGKSIEIPTPGEQFSLGDATVTVLGPRKQYEETNDTSIVLRIVYGNTSFLFTGDMERLAETDLVESGVTLASTLLKVGHHGSESSTSYRFLRAVAPTYAVISVGTDNSYGHPHDEVLCRLRDAEVQLYRTDLQGDILCRSNGEQLTFTTQKGTGVPTNPTQTEGESGTQGASEYAYVGNINSHVFHTPGCSSLPAEQNRIYFITRDEATGLGYTPCGRCNP